MPSPAYCMFTLCYAVFSFLFPISAFRICMLLVRTPSHRSPKKVRQGRTKESEGLTRLGKRGKKARKENEQTATTGLLRKKGQKGCMPTKRNN